jgi:membrane protein
MHDRKRAVGMISVLKAAFAAWKQDNIGTYASSLAYYAVFSMAPLLVIAIAAAGIFFGAEEARSQIASQIAGLLGNDAAAAINGIVQNASKQKAGPLAGAIGVAMLLFGAAGVFGELKRSLNAIWKVKQKEKSTIWNTIQDRFLSFAMVFGTCFMLVVSLVISATVTGIVRSLPLEAGPILYALDLAVSVVVFTLMFAGLYRFVPDTPIRGKDVWFGAAFTAALMTVGKILIGAYLGRSGVASSYGAAGGIVLVLLWTNYASQILFFGAEITKAHADGSGDGRPDGSKVQ